jgi:hypothetical protein
MADSRSSRSFEWRYYNCSLELLSKEQKSVFTVVFKLSSRRKLRDISFSLSTPRQNLSHVCKLGRMSELQTNPSSKAEGDFRGGTLNTRVQHCRSIGIQSIEACVLCIGTLCLQLALKYPIYHRCIVISFIAEGKPPWPVYTHSPIYGHQTTSQRHNDTKRERESARS